MGYENGLRRWLLIDRWTTYSGEQRDHVIGRAWTRWGARLHYATLRPFLRPRGGQATILLHDQKTDRMERLSTQ